MFIFVIELNQEIMKTLKDEMKEAILKAIEIMDMFGDDDSEHYHEDMETMMLKYYESL